MKPRRHERDGDASGTAREDDTRLEVTIAGDAGDRPAPPAAQKGDAIGRYVVIGAAGKGGMGEVLRAYDPRLHREVALKRLLARSSWSDEEGEKRLLREARAMARLNHPNVIAVYDVEQIDNRTYLAMEYVEGVTITEWLAHAPRSCDEVLAIFAQAARGLAAAHGAGLVHRDFKPSNVLVATDGRARVTDFGLARTAMSEHERNATIADGSPAAIASDPTLTAGGVQMGTPPYMAPEQHAGQTADARADQYAWCVALWEALFGKRPFSGDLRGLEQAKRRGPPSVPTRSDAPPWIGRILERGLAVDREARFGTMHELLAALERGHAKARRRRRWAIAIGAVAIAGVVQGGRVLSRDRARAACEREGALVNEIWNDATRERLRTDFAAVKSDATLAIGWLDAWSEHWHDSRRTICERTRIDGTWTEAQAAAGRACLDDHRLRVDVLLEALSAPEPDVVARVVVAVARLESPADCTDPIAIARDWTRATATTDAHADILRAIAAVNALSATGQYDAALERGRSLLAEAQTLGDEPLFAQAALAVASAALKHGDYEDAATHAERAFMTALAHGRSGVAIDAALGLAEATGVRDARKDEGLRWIAIASALLRAEGTEETTRHAAVLAGEMAILVRHDAIADAIAAGQRAVAIHERIVGPDHLVLATPLTNLGLAFRQRGDLDEASALMQRALAIRERVVGPDHPEVAVSLANLSAVQFARGAYGEAQALSERALAIEQRTLGEDHPNVARKLGNLAVLAHVRGDPEAAAKLLEQALAIVEARFGPTHVDLVMHLSNLSNTYLELGHFDQALWASERALAIAETNHDAQSEPVAMALFNLARVREDREELEPAAAAYERALAIRQAQWGPDDLRVGKSLAHLARIAYKEGRPADAGQMLERALAILEHTPEGTDRSDLALTRSMLATVLWPTAPDRAIELARAAADDYRGMDRPFASKSVAELEAWLAEHTQK